MSIGERSSARPPACEELSFSLWAGGLRLQAKTILPPDTSLTGNRPTLVFLHEGLGSITQWRTFPLALAAATGLPALVYDRCGYGKSEAWAEPPGPSFLETEAYERLPQLLAACGIEAPILVGHSDGATIALLCAARFPGLPLGVLAEAAHPFVEDQTVQGIWRTLRAFENTPLRDRLMRHHGAKVDALFHGWSGVWLAPAFRDWSMVHLLPAITCPVLAIQGERDEYGTPDQVRTILQGVSGPVEGLLLPGCAHAPHHQARDQVMARAERFIEGIVTRFSPSARSSGSLG
ncbi:MAG: alpha/beta hydrolase [Holophaga sp.]|nr:alpha/beta hydrolase [Holophaga sp.]